MIEIYLFPDPNNVGVEALTDSSLDHMDSHYREVDSLIDELLRSGMGGGNNGGTFSLRE
jgi:hypothetical protein